MPSTEASEPHAPARGSCDARPSLVLTACTAFAGDPPLSGSVRDDTGGVIARASLASWSSILRGKTLTGRIVRLRPRTDISQGLRSSRPEASVDGPGSAHRGDRRNTLEFKGGAVRVRLY